VAPPLTTIQQPTRDIARGAAELALRRLNEETTGTPTTMVFRTQLVERGSVAPIRKGRAAKAASPR